MKIVNSCTRTVFLHSPLLDSRYHEIPFSFSLYTRIRLCANHPPASSFLYLLIRIHISLRFYAFYCSSCLTFVSSTRCHSFLFSLSKRILSSTVRNDLSPSSTPSHPLPFYQYCNRVFYCFYNLLLYSYIMFSAFSSNRLMVTNERRSYTNLHGRTSTGI